MIDKWLKAGVLEKGVLRRTTGGTPQGGVISPLLANLYARALAAVTEWCRLNLHRPFREQHAHLSRVIRGHCAYYGITGNSRRLKWYHHQVVWI